MNKTKIILYAGSDFSTLMTLNKLVPALVSMGIEPIMVFPEAPASKKAEAVSPEMQEFSFFDRELMQETIIPFMDKFEPILDANMLPKKHICYTPTQLCEFYKEDGVQAYKLDDVNSVAHREYIKEDRDIIGGISIRCLQIFEQPVIDAHTDCRNLPENSNGILWNLHPGRLPDYRGLLPIFRAVASEKKYIDWTLHAIEDETIDTGTVYGNIQQSVDPSKGILWHYSSNVDAVSAMIVKNLGDVLDHGKPRTEVTQDKSQGAYFSYPTASEIKNFKENDHVWVDKHAESKRFLTSAFANSSPLRKALDVKVSDAVNIKFDKPRIKLKEYDSVGTPANTNHFTPMSFVKVLGS